MTEEVFGDILRELRTEKGFSQEHLAELSGLDRTYVSLLERGLRQPTLSTLFSLANALEVAPSKIVQLIEKQNASK
ncbi:transcriptional regulator [Sphingobacteriaceae bacterium]|nr:transcriptional regulator [Sphingobacteriaceae bacterium]